VSFVRPTLLKHVDPVRSPILEEFARSSAHHARRSKSPRHGRRFPREMTDGCNASVPELWVLAPFAAKTKVIFATRTCGELAGKPRQARSALERHRAVA
jgi:hypothetical protein